MSDETKKVEEGGAAFPLRMNAYYYSFSTTGCNEIDRILSAVACAGKAFHNTDCWRDECAPYEGHVGDNPIDWIQNAANDCTTSFKSAYAAGIKAGRASRDGLRVELERLACVVGTYLKDGCNCDNGSPTEDCFCIKEEDAERAHKALEADGGVK